MWPPTDVIVAPEARPASSAGEPESTPTTVAPEAAVPGGVVRRGRRHFDTQEGGVAYVDRQGRLPGLDLLGQGKRLIYGDGIALGAGGVLGTDELELEGGRRRSVDSDNLAARVDQRAAGITGLDVGVGFDQPVNCSAEPDDSSEAVIDWSRSVTVPGAADGVPPAPPALPIATTLSPTATVLELPREAVCSPEAPWSFMTATSEVAS